MALDEEYYEDFDSGDDLFEDEDYIDDYDEDYLDEDYDDEDDEDYDEE